MKKTLFILLVSILAFSAHAQFANTKWKATLKPEDPVDAYFTFGTDTLTVTRVDNGLFVENMLFTVKDSVLTIQKIVGGSGCETSVVGKYKFTKNDEGIFVAAISDDCIQRVTLLDKTIWIKQ